MSRRPNPQIIGPREFFLELRDLFRALELQKDTLTPVTKDALARVLSWLPHMQQTAPSRTKLGKEIA